MDISKTDNKQDKPYYFDDKHGTLNKSQRVSKIHSKETDNNSGKFCEGGNTVDSELGHDDLFQIFEGRSTISSRRSRTRSRLTFLAPPSTLKAASVI